MFAEDENLKINIYSKNVFYDHETYKVTITNRSSHPIVIADGSTKNEVTLYTGEDNRNEKAVGSYEIMLKPNETTSYTFLFNKYCDDGRAPEYMMFNDIRVLRSYSGNESTKQEELDNAIRRYTLRINFHTT